MSASKRLRVLVINELLAGKEVRGALFALQIDADSNSVRAVLRELKPFLTCRAEKTGHRGPNRIFYSVRDEAALIAIRDRDSACETEIEQSNDEPFAALQGVWGIAPRRLNLPTYLHRVAVDEDGPEPILV